MENQSSGKLKHLTRTIPSNVRYNKRYSVFIRWMRLVLPMVALAMITVIFTWSNMQDDNIVPVQGQSPAVQTIGKNELVNPHFESMDEKSQPFTITAKRAIQGEANENLVILEEPVGDMLLSSGNWIAIKADQGAFRQDNNRLLLRGNVHLFHDQGYQLETQQLHVDMNKNTAWSDMDVYGQGPAGTIEAKGMEATVDQGNLIFKGPAKLVLNRSSSDIGIGSIFGE